MGFGHTLSLTKHGSEFSSDEDGDGPVMSRVSLQQNSDPLTWSLSAALDSSHDWSCVNWVRKRLQPLCSCCENSYISWYEIPRNAMCKFPNCIGNSWSYIVNELTTSTLIQLLRPKPDTGWVGTLKKLVCELQGAHIHPKFRVWL